MTLDQSSYASRGEKQTDAKARERSIRRRADDPGSRRIGLVSTARLDELRAQALHARQRYDLYRARSYGPRATSPSRLRELERQSAQAQAALRFAEAEAKREAPE